VIVNLGIDTGFFIGYANQHPRATEIWRETTKGAHELIVSTLTVNEVFTYFYKRGLGKSAESWLLLMQATEMIQLLPVSIDIAVLSARYRLGMQLSTVDSLILATFLTHGCEKMISSDSDFAIVAQQNILLVELLR